MRLKVKTIWILYVLYLNVDHNWNQDIFIKSWNLILCPILNLSARKKNQNAVFSRTDLKYLDARIIIFLQCFSLFLHKELISKREEKILSFHQILLFLGFLESYLLALLNFNKYYSKFRFYREDCYSLISI
jgi:hypothetical protein